MSARLSSGGSVIDRETSVSFTFNCVGPTELSLALGTRNK